MNSTELVLHDRIRGFASDWVRLGDGDVGERILADPVLVLGPQGTAPVARSDFLAAVLARGQAVSSAPASNTVLASVTAHELGERMVLATISWTFSSGSVSTSLVGDFLLLNEGPETLRCVAYLPRTNVLDHLASTETT